MDSATPSIYEATANFLGQTEDLEIPIERPRSIVHKIQSGENLSSIFPMYGLNTETLKKITHSNKVGAGFSDLKANKILKIDLDDNYDLESLTYETNVLDTLIASRYGDDFEVHKDTKSPEVKEALSQGVITTSLSADGEDAGLPPKIINKLADKIFAWDLDFSKDIHEGDKFTVVYEELLVDGKRLTTGDILAAEMIIAGKSYSAIRYKDKEGNIEYYSPQGKGSHGKKIVRRIRKAFLRSPIEFARVSSHFNMRRKHPVLNRIRAHKGVDYAAVRGTPIKTVGHGKITFRGRQRGYGNVVIVQHDNKKYSTLYAHMSKFSSKHRLGGTVNQGDVIGYVGKTGLASGYHLHYEFLVNGVHKNPLTVKVPRSEKINVKEDKAFLARFKKQTQPYVDQLNKANLETASIKVDKLFSRKK